TPVDEKISYLQTFPIDRLVIISFTPEFAAWSAGYFVNNLLRSAIGMKEIIIGHDHAFGNARAGTLDTLRNLGNAGNFGITVVPPLIDAGVPISSTLIRRLLMEGNMEQAAKYLGRPYMIQGRVVPGDGRGRTLNYPTANMALENADKMIPRDGVYICEAEVDSQRYKGMLSIGYRPTFPESNHTIEMHLLNFSGNIYDKIIKAHVLHFLRMEIKFNSVEELIQRMDRDREETITYFSHKYPIEMLS
ncbi:MAG: riboflavin biosynthesis protein RibF, partial [Patescibacteria group bacterium]|nr:riboflavin biosynthesis protein RibF [Patescibacteria group bacterium]